MILKAKDIDTTVTGTFTGHPVRVMRNKLARELEMLEKSEDEKKALERFDELGKGALQRAVIDGDVEYGSVMSGQIAGMVNKEQTCKEIIDEIVEGFDKLIKC